MEHINQYLQYLSGTAEKYEESEKEPISLTDYMLHDMEHFNDRFQKLRACNNRVAFKGTDEEEIEPTTRVNQSITPELTVTAQMLCDAKEGFEKLQDLCTKVILQIEELQAVMKFEEKEVEEPVEVIGLEAEEFYDDDLSNDEEFVGEDHKIIQFYNERSDEKKHYKSVCFFDDTKGRDSPKKRIQEFRRKEEVFFDDRIGEVFSFNARNQSIRMIDGKRRGKRRTYARSDHLVRMIRASGGFAGYTIDAGNQFVQMRNQNGIATRLGYEAERSIKKVENATENTGEYLYSQTGNVDALKDYNGKKVYYDSDERLISKTASSGHEVSYRYDSTESKIGQTNQSVNSMEYTYDLAERMNNIAYSHGLWSEYEYDNIEGVDGVRSANGFNDKFAYNSFANAVRKANKKELQLKDRMNQKKEIDLLLYGLFHATDDVHCIDEKQGMEKNPELRELDYVSILNGTATDLDSELKTPSSATKILQEDLLLWEAFRKQEAKRVVGSNDALGTFDQLMKQPASRVRKLQIASLLG